MTVQQLQLVARRKPRSVHELAAADDWSVPPTVRRLPDKILGPALKWAYVALFNMAGCREAIVEVAPADLAWLLGVDRSTAVKWLRRGTKGRTNRTDLESAGLIEVVLDVDKRPLINVRGEWSVKVFDERAALALVRDHEPHRPLLPADDDDDEESAVASGSAKATVAFSMPEATVASARAKATDGSNEVTVARVGDGAQGADSQGIACSLAASAAAAPASGSPGAEPSAAARLARERTHASSFNDLPKVNLHSMPKSSQSSNGTSEDFASANRPDAAAKNFRLVDTAKADPRRAARSDGPRAIGDVQGAAPFATLSAAREQRWADAKRKADTLQFLVRRAEGLAGIRAGDERRWCKPYLFNRWCECLFAGDLDFQHADELIADINRIIAEGNQWKVSPGAFINGRGMKIVGPRWLKENRDSERRNAQ